MYKPCIALVSLSSVFFAHLAGAEEASEVTVTPTAEVVDAPAQPEASAEVAPAPQAAQPQAGNLIASIAPATRPDPREDSAPEVFTSAKVAPPSPSTNASAQKDAPPSESDPHQGALGMFRLGALASAGFPSAVSGQVVFKIADWVGATASYGATPSIAIPVADDAHMSQKGFSATARVYPFRGAFFVGVGGGQSTMSADAARTESGVRAQSAMSTKTSYLMPELGFLHRFSFGLAIGADIGLQVPLSATTEVTASANGGSAPVPSDLRDAMNKVGTTPIPVLTFLRLGYVL